MEEIRNKLLRLEEVTKEMEELEIKNNLEREAMKDIEYDHKLNTLVKKEDLNNSKINLSYIMKMSSLRMEQFQLFNELFKAINELEERYNGN